MYILPNRLLKALSLVVLLTSLPAYGNISSNRLKDPNAVSEELKHLKTKMLKLESTITKQQQQGSRTIEELAKTDKIIGQKSEKLRKLQCDISKKERAIKALTSKIAKYTKLETAQQNSLAALVDHKFRRTEVPLSLLLKQRSLSDYSRLQHYYHYTMDAQNTKIQEYIKLVKNTQNIKDKRVKEQSNLKSLRASLDKENKALKQKNNDRKKLIAKLDQAISSDTARLKQMKKNQKQLEALLAQLHDAAVWIPEQKETPRLFSQALGKLQLPIHKKGAKLVPYNASKKHNDHLNKFYIPTKEGTLVYAIHPGRVIFSEWLRGFGLLMIIDHGEGFMSLYGHNQTLYKSTGDWVQGNEAITRVGKTGTEANSGLYFEVRKDGHPLDLSKWIATA